MQQPRSFAMNATYFQGTVTIDAHRYPNGRPAWDVIDTADGMSVFVATVNVPECADPRLDAGSHVLIKDYSENEGVLASLVAAKIIGEPVAAVALNFDAKAMLCPVTATQPDGRIA